MTDEFKAVTIAPLTTSNYASWSVEMEVLLKAKSLWKCTQVLAQDFMTTLGTLSLKEKDEIETKCDKALGIIPCFLDQTCKEIARGSLTAKDVWRTLKGQFEGKEYYSKIYLLTLLYTTKLEEGSLDVDGSHLEKTQWRESETSWGNRLPHSTYGSLSIFRTQRRILESRKDLSMEIFKKDLL